MSRWRLSVEQPHSSRSRTPTVPNSLGGGRCTCAAAATGWDHFCPLCGLCLLKRGPAAEGRRRYFRRYRTSRAGGRQGATNRQIRQRCLQVNAAQANPIAWWKPPSAAPAVAAWKTSSHSVYPANPLLLAEASHGMWGIIKPSGQGTSVPTFSRLFL